MFSSLAWAQANAPAAPSFLEQMVPFLIIAAFFWFVFLRPQQNRAKKHEEFLGQLKRGDEVLTASGMFGSIEGITDRFVTLEISDGVRIRILKNHIAAPAKEEPSK